MKLYKIILKGSLKGFDPCFVVAEDTKEAYERVLETLEKKDLGYKSDRELHTIQLMASVDDYDDLPNLLV